MTRRSLTFVSRAAVLIASTWPIAGSAQGGSIDAQCRNGTLTERATQDGCQKAIDILQFLAPQLGIGITGGNAVSGEHSALRGLGHFSLGIRANVFQSRLPRVGDITPSILGAERDDYTIRDQIVAVPTLDAAVGLFRGIPIAGSYALAVDGLVNVAYVPEVDQDDVAITVPSGSLKLGFGARLGVVQETFATPGVSVTVLRRDLPTVDIEAVVPNATATDDRLLVRDVDAATTAWRVVAGKNLAIFGVSVGAGQDRYKTSASAQVEINRAGLSVTSPVVSTTQRVTRTNVFANVALNLSLLRVVGEVGRVSGGRVLTYNSFDGDAEHDAPITYGSLGLRLSW